MKVKANKSIVFITVNKTNHVIVLLKRDYYKQIHCMADRIFVSFVLLFLFQLYRIVTSIALMLGEISNKKSFFF